MRPNSAEPLSFLDAEPERRFAAPPPPWLAPAPDGAPEADGGAPVTFGRTTGFFHAAPGAVGVLMLSPTGYEELCTRATWRALAAGIAAAGLPCLRFDYPGTGDALDPAGNPSGLGDWCETARAAAALLRELSGVDRLIVLGQGLGAALALAWAPVLGPVEGLALLAPIPSGRRYLRELGAWARLVTDGIGISRDPEDLTGCAVGGFLLSEDRAAAIRELDPLSTPTPPGAKVLLMARPGHAGDDALAQALAGAGESLTRAEFEGYDTLMTDPTAALVPERMIAAVTEWVARQTAASPPRPRAVAPSTRPLVTPLRDGDLVERPVRFGPGARLFGVFCGHAGRDDRTAIIFVNAGREYHAGWARSTVDQARAFAALGYTSLRFDCGGTGDSPSSAGGPEELLYSQAQIDDVRAAVDLVEAAGFRRIVLAGRCSGAYAALNAAVADGRVGHVLAVNLSRFVWDPEESVAEALRYAHRSFSDFGATFWKRDGFRRLLTGRLRVGAGLRHVANRLAKALSWRLAPLVGGLSRQGRLHREAHRRMAVLAERGARVSLVYSVGDPGLVELARRFGPAARQLARYRGASCEYVADADHNFTHSGARHRLIGVLSRILAE